MFSDEKLTQIKATCLLSIEEYGNKDAQDILALIARLEAAELVIDIWANLVPKIKKASVYKDWRKSKNNPKS